MATNRVDIHENKQKFKDLHKGSIFLHEGSYWIKLYNPFKDLDYNYNAVALDDGITSSVRDETDVVQIRVPLMITPQLDQGD